MPQNEDTMTQAERIIKALQEGPRTGDSLATELDAPKASVRRTIQELNRQGYRIAMSGRGARDIDAEYRLL